MIMTNDPLEMYIDRFQANLPSMTLAERQDIVDEIRSHVHDRVAAYGLSIPEVLERLGPPETVAGEYHRGNLVVRERFSLFVLPRIAFAAVVTAFHGIFLMVIAFYGYAAALACFGLLIARMLFPEQTALWMTQDWDLGMGAGPSSRCDGLSGKLASADCVWSRRGAFQPDDAATPAHLAQHEAMVSPRDRSAGSPNSFRRPQSRFESVEAVPGCAQPAHAGPHGLAEQLTTFKRASTRKAFDSGLLFFPVMPSIDSDLLGKQNIGPQRHAGES